MFKKLFPYIILFLFSILIGGFFALKTPIGTEQQTTIPITQRQTIADACQNAAEQLEGGIEVQIVNEYLRTVIARQPTSGQWAEEINTILQTAVSPNPIIYAKNLRLISKGLKQ